MGTTIVSLHLLVFTLMVFQCYGANQGPTTFIKTSCRATRYPPLCVQTLSSYANSIQQNPHQLAQTALSVGLARAGSAAKFILGLIRTAGLKPREKQALKDCMANMGVTVAQLKRSIKELSQTDNLPRRSFSWRVGNVQTWVSTAITNGNNCLDGFSGSAMDGSVKGAVSPKVLSVVQVTSNALALVNNFAARHKAGTSTNIP
ncbi:21 kDa protein-like [Ipomoea triloba]|uniref:21 kDa protein-like n=1 Tax=Ipomoea triloba TaxID=35885 RepID=UPI00125E3A37|nr:21 kDa protein-like [Ipomoea triloba]